MNTDFNQNNLRILLAKILAYLFTAMDCDITFTSYLFCLFLTAFNSCITEWQKLSQRFINSSIHEITRMCVGTCLSTASKAASCYAGAGVSRTHQSGLSAVLWDMLVLQPATRQTSSSRSIYNLWCDKQTWNAKIQLLPKSVLQITTHNQ